MDWYIKLQIKIKIIKHLYRSSWAAEVRKHAESKKSKQNLKNIAALTDEARYHHPHTSIALFSCSTGHRQYVHYTHKSIICWSALKKERRRRKIFYGTLKQQTNSPEYFQIVFAGHCQCRDFNVFARVSVSLIVVLAKYVMKHWMDVNKPHRIITCITAYHCEADQFKLTATANDISKQK